jgi:hypothetical protein
MRKPTFQRLQLKAATLVVKKSITEVTRLIHQVKIGANHRSLRYPETTQALTRSSIDEREEQNLGTQRRQHLIGSPVSQIDYSQYNYSISSNHPIT